MGHLTSSLVPAGGRQDQLRTASIWAALGILFVIAGGAALRFGDSGPLGIDEWWHGVAAVTRGSAPYAVSVFMAEVGGGVGAVACTAIAIALLLATRQVRDAAAVATAMLFGIAASETIKALVIRPRPWDQLYVSHGSSYPSGHSMGAAALAVSLALVVTYSNTFSPTTTRWVWVVSVAWILIMMWSRSALHVHWLSDTVAGALLGASAAILARRFWILESYRSRS